ncbi:diguanylate cyclase domain-containing protein [Glaciecola sp. SC05]|uniref:GGDEF domain-containing response regulator n=1 Tax=Glaciecola sp. SC05 TaxID=1987355 RepID=UPI0035292FE1
MRDAKAGREKHRLMVVDSAEQSADSYAALLGEYYELILMPSLDSAWEAVNRSPLPDAILIDADKQTEDALAFCHRIKENRYFQDVPVILLSLNSNPNLHSQAFSSGAADCIVKHAHISELLARLKRHITQYHKTMRLESLIYIDPLTHLPNAAKFKDVLKQEWARCARYWHHLSLLLIRVDNLPSLKGGINRDEYYAISARIADNLCKVGARPGDLLASVNENTFGLLLSDCGPQGANMKSAQIMQQLKTPNAMSTHQTSVENMRCTIAYTIAAPAGGSSAQELMSTTENLLLASQQAGVFKNDKMLGVEGL